MIDAKLKGEGIDLSEPVEPHPHGAPEEEPGRANGERGRQPGIKIEACRRCSDSLSEAAWLVDGGAERQRG